MQPGTRARKKVDAASRLRSIAPGATVEAGFSASNFGYALRKAARHARTR